MNNVRDRLVNLFNETHRSFIVENTPSDPELLANMTYRGYDPDFNLGEFIPVFDIEHTRFGRYSLTEGQVPIDYFSQNYLQVSGFNATDDQNGYRDIYRPTPILWKEFKTLSLAEPRDPRNHHTYRESANIYDWSEDNIPELNYYNDCMRKNLKFAYFRKSLELQAKTIGFYKLPYTCPRNARLPNRRTSGFAGDWGWLDETDGSLEDWVLSLNVDAESEVESFIKYLQTKVKIFHRELNLGDRHYWLEILKEPYDFIDNLKVYSDMLNQILAISSRCLSQLWKELGNTQVDLVKMIENTFSR